MNCSKYPPLLSRLLDRELSPWETAEVEGHLAQCAGCCALMENWRLQSVRLRSHLSRHSLGDDFVRKVVPIAPVQPSVTEISDLLPSRPKGQWRWLQMAAAIVVAAVALSLYFSGRSNVGFARVVDPGELEVLQSSTWVRATAGELLHPGDWLRNAVRGAPEIMWRDTCRLTLETGTLAHIPDSGIRPSDQVELMKGSLSSEINSGNRDFQVRTPAGAVTASAGRFTVRVTDYVLPKLRIAGDRSETLTGTVVPIGEVYVGDGTAKVQIREVAREVHAGMTAVFSGSEFANTMAHPGPIDASLRVVAGVSETGTMGASLTASSDNLWIDLEAANVSLKKLLEWAAATGVRGGESVNVTGNLRFPANSSPEAITSAVGAALGLQVSYKQEKASRTLAVGQLKPAPTSDWKKGEFTLEKSPAGTISFSFQAVPAGQVFKILRSAVTDLPELSAEAASIPITIQAAALHPAETAAWIGRTLGLQFKLADCQVGVVEVGPVPNAMPPADSSIPGKPPTREPQVSPIGAAKVEDRRMNSGNITASMTVPETSVSNPGSDATRPLSQAARPLWSILGGSTGPMAFPAAPGYGSADSAVAKGKATPKKRQFFGAAELLGKPEPSAHLIWPALESEGASGAEAGYLVVNHMELPARTLWSGYDRDGRLVAQYAFRVNGASTLMLLPTRDLPSFLGEGGHWETVSNLPLVGARERGSGDVLGLPVSAEHMTQQWAFPSAWLGMGARLWFANPTRMQATVVVAVMRNGKEIAAERLQIHPHGGTTWPEFTSGIGNGMTVVIHVLEGSIASGLK